MLEQEIKYPEYHYVEIALGSANRRGQVVDTNQIDVLVKERKKPVDCYRSMFRFQSTFQAYVEKRGSVSNYPGAAYSNFLWVDIDNDDLKKAQEQAERYIGLLENEYDFASAFLRCSFSGKKGFHIGIPMEAFALEPGADFNRLCKAIVRELTGGNGGVDMTVYDKTRLWRIENTIHGKSGLYAIPLSVSEVTSMPVGELRELAREPRELDYEIDTAKVEGLLEGLADTARRSVQENRRTVSPGVTTEPAAFPGDLAAVLAGCDFIQYCKENAETLSEPLWYDMVSNLARFEGGVDAIHQLSSAYPGYNKAETDAKIKHARAGSKPITCEKIREDGFDCPRRCIVKSPAGLGYKDNVTKAKRRTSGEQRQALSAQIYSELQANGKFIRTDTDYFYFVEGKLLALQSMDFTAMLNDKYSLVESESDFAYVIADLKSKCHSFGERADVYQFAYYDRKCGLLYVDRFDGKMYKLNGSAIELLSNGDDGVLFQSVRGEPYEIMPTDETKWIEAFLLGRISFEESVLATDEQMELLNVWLESIFFESVMPTKPLLLFTGVKGSGKSCAIRMIGRMLFGDGYNVDVIPAEERDFLAIVSNNYLPGFDNADSKKYWLQDRLATIATGQTIQLRKLYTTNEVERYHPRCFLMLTARTPRFKRDDVVERLLIFRLERLERFRPERALMADIAEHRNKLLSELFVRLNADIKKLKSAAIEDYSGSFRLADFADFAWKTAKKPERVIQALEKMSDEQSEFLLEDDSFVECLNVWLENTANAGREVTAKQLFDELKEVAEDNELTFAYKTALGLSMKLKHQVNNLRRFFQVKIIKHGRGHANSYVFQKVTESSQK